jgi:hypothetical protein
MEAYGECLPRHENRVSLNDQKPDKWGMPTLDIDMTYGPNELTFNQCHDAANVFVTDGACTASTACQNPSLTYMALTARACAYAVEQMKRGEIPVLGLGRRPSYTLSQDNPVAED